MKGKKPRYKARDVFLAQRQSWAAVRHVKNQPGLVRVLMALHVRMLSYQRLEDSLSHKQIAAEAGVSQRTVRRALRSLHDYGAIHYTPGFRRGKGPDDHRRSVIRLAPTLSATPFNDRIPRWTKLTSQEGVEADPPRAFLQRGRATVTTGAGLDFSQQEREHAERMRAEAAEVFGSPRRSRSSRRLV